MSNSELKEHPRVAEIEHLIAIGEMNAAQVFTQMKQLVYRQAPCHMRCESQAFNIRIRSLESDNQTAQARIQELEGVCDNYNSMCSQQDERIKELEANQVICAAGCREREELIAIKERNKELEAQVERLRGAWNEAIGNADDDGTFDVALNQLDYHVMNELFAETPAQSLEAVKREAEIEALKDFGVWCINRANAYHQSPGLAKYASESERLVGGYIEQTYSDL